MSKAAGRQERLREAIELRYNNPGSPRSGRKPRVVTVKVRGSRLCGRPIDLDGSRCDSRISMNARSCAACAGVVAA
jgi:hypothetical protein